MLLTPAETDTLIALMDRIVPEDDFPSASQAGVLNYVLGILNTDMAASAEWFRQGLIDLSLAAEAQDGACFAMLEPHRQDALISKMLAGSPKDAGQLAGFLHTSINLVSEGYYADPENGGNRDAASWNMIGFKIEEGVRLPVASA